MKIVVALGGNSLIKEGQKGTFEEQTKNLEEVCREMARLVKDGHDIVITHGNGPQVGTILENTKFPLNICVAITQAEIGYLIQNILKNELERLQIEREVMTVLTQVLVDKNDASFRNPTKPVGLYHKEKESKDAIFVEGRGYRKVVPSPRPREIIESRIIKKMVGDGYIVIACGGGGIPVVEKSGKLIGLEAVIDKDLTAAKLAKLVGADTMLVLTDVDGVYINYGKANQKKMDRLSVSDVEHYLEEGQFGEGSMKEKMEACTEFLKNGGKKCIVALPEKAISAIENKAGTLITN